MINRLNYVHSLFFFIFCILISSFDYLRSNSFILVCFFLILTLGISHGSLDNLKGKKLIKIYKIKNMFLFYLSYILIGLFIILLWLISAYILLAIFLIVASYHFGKEDAEFLNTKKKENIFLFFLKGSFSLAIACQNFWLIFSNSFWNCFLVSVENIRFDQFWNKCCSVIRYRP